MRVKNTGRISQAALVTATVVVVAALRLGRDVLIPFALAVLISFLLAPLVIRLQRRIPRVAAVALVTAMTFTAVAVGGWFVLGQVVELAQNLPEYKDNILEKIRSVRGSMRGGFGRVSQTLEEIASELSVALAGEQPGVKHAAPAPPVDAPAAPPAQPPAASALGPWVAPFLALIGAGSIVTVFVVFMLLYYDELRDRLLRLVGVERLNETTQALDEAAERVSRYLLMQTVINATHGAAVGIGMYFLGLPGALVWALASTLLRYIPYLGPVLAAVMPIALALAVSDGWTLPLVTVGFFIVLEIISNNFLEPWLYGGSMGLTPIAVVVAAVFWTWLWGGVGLVLSAPLTACLVVLGKHVPQLEFLSILLGDQPVLEPKDRLYGRLLAMDRPAAREIVEQYLKHHSLIEVYDDVLLPALAHAERDRHRGELEEAREKFILANTREMIDELGNGQLIGATRPNGIGNSAISVLCLPARDEADELAGLMFARILELDGYRARCMSFTSLAAEMMDSVEREGAQIICVSAVPPSALAHARYLCKRLRPRFERLDIVVGMWTLAGDPRSTLERVAQDESIHGVVTLAAARAVVGQLAHTVIPDALVDAAGPAFGAAKNTGLEAGVTGTSTN